MKVSLNTIKRFTDIQLSVDELVKKINQQIGQVEEVTDLRAKYAGPVIVRVVTCIVHPDSDHMHICTIDDAGVVADIERDEAGYVQVVCGAPNVRTGMLAAWLPPNSTVPSSFDDSEPFVLGSRKLRGAMSHGMLASPKELALGDDHDGILEIDPLQRNLLGIEIKPGVNFAKAYGLDDIIIDIENKMFTHRPDCFGQIGVAREIAGIQQHKFISPEWYLAEHKFEFANGLELDVANEAIEKVSRFMAVSMRGVAIGPSPLWLQAELVRLGGKPINNVVDITNYVMLLTGQPLHAYDYDKIRDHKLGVRMARQGEMVPLLNGKTYELTPDDIVIVDGQGPIGLGGVMGGGNSEVNTETKNIVLEAATFDMYAIRKTSMRHGLFTDAVTRFNKGQSPLQNDRILRFAMNMLRDMAGGNQASPVFDFKMIGSSKNSIATSARFITDRLGLNLSEPEIANLLENVEFMVEQKPLVVRVPFWRTDIIEQEDIVEEVGRLYGFDKLPRELPRRSILPASKTKLFETKKSLRSQLARFGANEVLTYSFVHEKLMKNAAQDATQAFRLGNALSPELQYFRLSLTPSLLDKVHGNIKAGHDEFALFEIGKGHRKGDNDETGLPREYKRLALVYTAKKSEQTAFYVAREYVTRIAPDIDLVPLDSFDQTSQPVIVQQMLAPFEPKRSAILFSNTLLVGVVGEYKASVIKSFKLPNKTAGFEMYVSYFMKDHQKHYVPLSRFPAIMQDVTLSVSDDIPFSTIFDSITDKSRSLQFAVMQVNVEPKGIYLAEGSDRKNITFGLKFVNTERTMTDDEAGRLISEIVNYAAATHDARQV